MTTLRQIAGIANMQQNVCLRSIAAANGIQPVCFRNVLERLTVKKFHADVTTPSPESLGGSVDLTIRGDGSYELNVSMHDSGAPNYSFRLAILLRSIDGKILAMYSNGTVYGTFSKGSRDFDDTQTGTDFRLQMEWYSFASGSFEVHHEYRDSLTAFLSDAFFDILGFVATAATVAGPAALVIWGGKALGSLTGVELPADLGWAGLILAEGQLVLAGPTFFIPMFVAGVAITAELFKTRPLHPTEIAESKLVFLDTVPYDAITVSNVSDSNGNCFAAPGPTGNYLIGASSSYDDFLADHKGIHALIHELTHVWQMENTLSESYVSCDSLSEIVGERTLDETAAYFKYYYYFPWQPWDSYNFEQQAQIVSDWWLATRYNDMDLSISDTILNGPKNEIYIDAVIRLGKV